MESPAPPRSAWRSIPSGVWALGFVSLLMDISSEMIHALLPVYLITALGASVLTVGIIEGVAEATAAIVKIFSGALSDWLGRRKLLVALGYGLAAFTKPIFPLANSVDWLIAARFIDRFGKGIRGAPRDALIADIAPPALRGASFGLRQSLDTVGAFTGPLLAVGLMWLTWDNFSLVFWVAVIPAVMAAVLVLVAVKEPQRAERPHRAPALWRRGELSRLGTAYWWIVVVGATFTLARFSEAFLIIRAQSVGLPAMFAPGILVVMNVAYAISSYPAGVLSDRMHRGTLLIAGLIVLLLADLVLAVAGGLAAVLVGTLLWGLHMGLTQGLFAALVADAAPSQLRGTAFGMFNLVTGLVLLVASVVAGAAWEIAGPEGTFLLGAVFAGLTLLGLVVFRRQLASGEVHRLSL